MRVGIIIPVGSRHREIASRAVESAASQTVPCEVITVHDDDGHGPAWARNVGVKRLRETPGYLVFLDADDEIKPDFVEKALSVAAPDRYVYTDWTQGGALCQARPATEVYCFCPRPLDAGGKKHFHPVTTLIPHEWYGKVGGFDESLTEGGEDKAFYVALNMSGCCGVALHEPLFVYHNGGKDSRGARWTSDYKKQKWLHDILIQKYGGIMSPCRSCGGARSAPRTNVDSQIEMLSEAGVLGKPGLQIPLRLRGGGVTRVNFDCKAQCRARSHRSTTGKATRFNYAVHYNRRLKFPNMIWMDKRDAAADPALWQIIETIDDINREPKEPTEIDPDYQTIIEAGQRGLESGGVFR